MKKITLLLFLTVVCLGYSQSVDFMNQPNMVNDPTGIVEANNHSFAPCTVSVPSNALENGSFLGGATNQLIAIDIDVAADEVFTIEEFIPTFVGAGTTFEIIIYENDIATVLPGTLLQTVSNADITVTNDVITGSNFGFDFHQISLSLNTPIVLNGGAAGTKYWLELQSDADGWETTTANTEGTFLAFNNDNNGNVWAAGTSECVYELVGDCSAVDLGPVCGGQYIDTGGVDAGYSNSESITTTITPDVAGDFVTATFTYVDIETATGAGNQDGCWDYLTIYDGPDDTFPVLAQTLCGEESGDGSVPSDANSLLSVGMSFTSTDASGALTFVFTSDTSVPETGWVADITCAPSCEAPTALTAANITTDGADLGWTENNATAAATWDVEWGAPGFTPDTATEVGMTADTADNPYTVTGLTDGTTYEFYVRADCDVTDSSAWAGPFEFTTETIVVGPICGGQYVDSGGDAGDYSNSESITTTITPDVGGDVVTATFTYVDIETATGAGSQDGCWDYLTVYNGPDDTFPVLAQTLCGEESGDGGVPSDANSLLSVGMSFTSTDASGALTFVFTSDTSVPETGWVADITCAPPVVSVSDLETVGFEYFPNPVNDNLTLRANENITLVSIVNVLGQEVKRIRPSAIEAVVDMSNLQTGTYFVKAQINDKTGTFKIIKR